MAFRIGALISPADLGEHRPSDLKYGERKKHSRIESINEEKGMSLMSSLEMEKVCGESVTPAEHSCPPFPLLHPETPLEKYALFLQACYTKHKLTSTKWPHLDGSWYINLAVIDNVYSNRG